MHRFIRRSVCLSAICLGVSLAFVVGCSNLSSKKEEKGRFPEKFTAEIESGKTMLIGDYTNIGNYSPVAVHGFGLVVGLPGTGANDANTFAYKMVYDDMNRRNIQNIRGILADPSTAVVEILGYMRPGIRAGERFDVQVMLPPDTTGKSLRGGKLLTAKLQEMAILDGGLRESEAHAYIEGPIMVDDPLATETTNAAGLHKGIILSGASAKDSRFLSLNMKSGMESAFITDRIAKEINHRFFVTSGQHKDIATAKSDSLIVLDIHPTYINDTARYVKVIQSIACYENPAKQIKRIEELKNDLHNPEKAQKAAFQLEAIGKPGIEALKSALNSDNVEVRFHAATSLAYLGDSSPAKVLTEIARDEPAFRVYALNALSVMKNELEAETYLQELLHVTSAETRYGAFRSLKTRNPYDQTIRGEVLGNQFTYHGITSGTTPMVHISKQKRPEVVFFGTDIYLKQPFGLDAGPVIFVNGQSPGSVVVNRFAVNGLDEKRTVSNRLDEIIRAVVEMGGTYPDVVQLLCQADQSKVLSCRLAIDCLPEPNRIYRRPGGSTEEETEAEPEKPKSKNVWERMNPKNLFAPNPGAKSSDFEGPVNTSSRD